MTSDTRFHPNRLLQLLWQGIDDAQRKGLIDLAIARCTSIFDLADLELSCDGRRWPDTISMTKFIALLGRRGSTDLYGFDVFPKEGSTLFRLEISCDDSSLRNTIRLRCDSVLWEKIGGREFVASILHLVPITVGFEMSITSPLIRDALGFFPIWSDKDPDFFGTMEAYFELRRRWSLQNKLSWINEFPKAWLFRRLWMIYPFNIVSRQHLNDIGYKGQSLKNWISSDPRRGNVDQVTESNAIWDVETRNLESTVRELWTSGFFPCTEHFEIVGWSDRWQLPELRAKRSVLDLLDETSLSDTKFLDGEEPAVVTAYKKKVGKA